MSSSVKEQESIGCDACGKKGAELGCDFCHRSDVKYCSRECRAGLGWVKHEAECNVVRSEQLCATPYAWQNLAPHAAWEQKMQDEAVAVCNKFPSYLVKHDLPDQLTVTQTVIPAIRESKPVESEHSEEERVKDHTFEVFVNGVSMTPAKKPLKAPDAMISTHSTNAAAQRLVESRIARPQSRTYWVSVAAATAVSMKLGALNVIELVRNGDKDRARRVEFHLPAHAQEDFAEQVQQRLGQGLKGFWQEQMRWKGLGKQTAVAGISSHHAFNPEMGDGVVFTVDKELKLVDLEFYVARDPKPVRLQQQTFQKTVDDTDSNDIQALAMALEDILEENPRHEQAQLHLASLLDFFHSPQRDDAATLTKARVAIGEAVRTLNEEHELIGRKPNTKREQKIERVNEQLGSMTPGNMREIYEELHAEIKAAAGNLRIALRKQAEMRVKQQQQRGFFKRLFSGGKKKMESVEERRSRRFLESVVQAASDKLGELDITDQNPATNDKVPAFWIQKLRNEAQAALNREWDAVGTNMIVDAGGAPEYTRRIELRTGDLFGDQYQSILQEYRRRLRGISVYNARKVVEALVRDAQGAAQNLRDAKERQEILSAEDQTKRGVKRWGGKIKKWWEGTQEARSMLVLRAIEQASREKLNMYIANDANVSAPDSPAGLVKNLHDVSVVLMQGMNPADYVKSQLDYSAAPIGAWFKMPNQPGNVIWLSNDVIDGASNRDFEKGFMQQNTLHGTVKKEEDVLRGTGQNADSAFWFQPKKKAFDKDNRPRFVRTGYNQGYLTLSTEDLALLNAKPAGGGGGGTASLDDIINKAYADLKSAKKITWSDVEEFKERVLEIRSDALKQYITAGGETDAFNDRMKKFDADSKQYIQKLKEGQVVYKAEDVPEETVYTPKTPKFQKKKLNNIFSDFLIDLAEFRNGDLSLSSLKIARENAITKASKSASIQDARDMTEAIDEVMPSSWNPLNYWSPWAKKQMERIDPAKSVKDTEVIVQPLVEELRKDSKKLQEEAAKNPGILKQLASRLAAAFSGMFGNTFENELAKISEEYADPVPASKQDAKRREDARNIPYPDSKFKPSRDPSHAFGERGNYYYGYEGGGELENRVREAIGSLFPEHVEGHDDFDALNTHHVLSHDPELVQEIRQAYAQHIGVRNKDFTQKAYEDGLRKALEKAEKNYKNRFERQKKSYARALDREDRSIARGKRSVERKEARLDKRSAKASEQRAKNFDYGYHPDDYYYGADEDDEF